ncbi:MAG: P-loop NTPase [Rectinemataceae bacterium]
MLNIPDKVYNPRIKRVIGVASGKGGVGKSTVAVLLAQALAASGRSVGILDADITGPSIPRLLGIDSFRSEADETHLYPVVNEEGIRVVSINLVNEVEDDPVIWRGPLLGKALQQFWEQTAWGDLDYLVVDFPPGTSDIALTAFQTIPLDGLVVVATPQDYVAMIVHKMVRMAAMLKTPVLGVVRNMATMVCPHCGESIDLFADGGAGLPGSGLPGSGHSGAEHGSAGHFGAELPLLADLPWRRELAQARSLRWSGVGEEARKDALGLAAEVEMALNTLTHDSTASAASVDSTASAASATS